MECIRYLDTERAFDDLKDNARISEEKYDSL